MGLRGFGKKFLVMQAVPLLMAMFLTAENSLPLVDAAEARGMTLYWDSLSESGMLEKNGIR